MKVALYARVSTDEQTPESQLARLRDWAVANKHDVVMERAEIASGRLTRRPIQDELMGEALGRRVDAVAVVKVDRWARSLKHLATTVEALHGRGCAFFAVEQGLAVVKGDPTSNLILGILAAVAEWEGSIISERTRLSMAYVRDVKKKHVGRPRKGGPKTDTPVLQSEGGLERVPFPSGQKGVPVPKGGG